MTVPDLSPQLTESQKLNLNVISLNTKVNDLSTDVGALNKVVLLGNGELPLREQVRNHDSFIKDVRYWVRFIGGALILQTITFGVAVIIAVVKFLPILEKLAQSH